MQELLGQQGYENQTAKIEEEPFLTFNNRARQLCAQLRDAASREDKVAIAAKAREVIRQATVAYVERETQFVKEYWQEKGIKIFSTSAMSYMAWDDPVCESRPYLDREARGIPALTRFFLGVPAETNLKNYHDHITKCFLLGASVQNVFSKSTRKTNSMPLCDKRWHDAFHSCKVFSKTS